MAGSEITGISDCDEKARASYNRLHCLYCGYAPGPAGRLVILIINNDPAWVCLRCEAQTIIQGGETT